MSIANGSSPVSSRRAGINLPDLCLIAARLCCLMSLFPSLSPLRVAGLGAETNCCSEMPRLSVSSVKPWKEASRVLHRERRCLTLCCLRGPRTTAVLCVSQEGVRKEPQAHSKVLHRRQDFYDASQVEDPGNL
ncbi:hypothetical protein NDU88_002723 [Pleurodeles waltl]|uniref:Uncharacterized protein n=1 Tax=Pleurodeles waltl TaxID=8319 RepID=A0AAV7L227_PLEWA|nr:hypothetical protein NDU88_002723 [Pleurodeles waltl]